MVPTHGSLVLTSHPPKADALSRVRGCPSRPGSLLVPVRDGGSHRAVYSVDSLYFLTFEMRRATRHRDVPSVGFQAPVVRTKDHTKALAEAEA